MLSYAMTDDFASAMVTVIPIVLLVGTAEVTALVRTPITRDPVLESTTAGRAWLWLKRMGKKVISLAWLVLIAQHLMVEGDLISWLATAEHTNDPQLAKRTVLVSVIGFFFVTMVTLILAGVRLADPEGLIRALAEAKAPTKRTPSSRRRTRALYPAHRAVRRPRRSPRRAGTTRAR